MADVASFHTTLVVGAVKTGKTSLMASLSRAPVTTDYEGTVVATKYIDVQRKMVFIDTPGVKDIVLSQSTNLRESNQNKYQAFYDDALVKELRGAYLDPNQYKVFQDQYCCSKVMNNMNSIDAVMILYTDCKFSQRVAKALRFMYHRKLLEDDANRENGGMDATGNSNRLKVFTVRVTGDFNRNDVLAEHQRRLLSSSVPPREDKRSANYVYYHDVEAVYSDEPVATPKLKYDSCSVLPDVHLGRDITVDEALFRLQTQLGAVYGLDDDDADKGAVDAAEANRRDECSPCTIM
jgi:hypothetical protein